MGEKLLFRPGTIFIIVFMALFGIVFYSWASGSINELGRDTSERQSSTVSCAGLDVEFVRMSSEGRNSTVFFIVNRDVEGLNVELEGDGSVYRRIEDVRKGTLQNASGSVGDLDRAVVEVGSCDQSFEYRG